MRLPLALALLALGISASAEARKLPPPLPQAVEGQTVQPPVAEGGYPYLLFVPKGYNESASDRWPLVIFLHGSGERGTDINVVKKHVKPNPMKGITGGVIDKTLSIHQSNVAIFNAATGKADRVGVKLLGEDEKKSRKTQERGVRVFRSSGAEIKV